MASLINETLPSVKRLHLLLVLLFTAAIVFAQEVDTSRLKKCHKILEAFLQPESGGNIYLFKGEVKVVLMNEDLFNENTTINKFIDFYLGKEQHRLRQNDSTSVDSLRKKRYRTRITSAEPVGPIGKQFGFTFFLTEGKTISTESDSLILELSIASLDTAKQKSREKHKFVTLPHINYFQIIEPRLKKELRDEISTSFVFLIRIAFLDIVPVSETRKFLRRTPILPRSVTLRVYPAKRKSDSTCLP